MDFAKLHPLKLGLSGGLIWGISVFFLTLICIHTGYAQYFLEFITPLYPGFSISYLGALIGLIYSFVDMGIFLFLLAWIYNKLNG